MTTTLGVRIADRTSRRERRRKAGPRVEALEARALMAAGDLDPTFGTGGVLVGNFPFSATLTDLAVQPDGKIVVAGAAALSGTSPTLTDILLARFNPDGSLDTSFGGAGNGYVLTDSGSTAGNAFIDVASEVLIQPDGKIVVGGTASQDLGQFFNRPSRGILVRYTPEGRPDPTFGAGGVVTSIFPGTLNSNINGIAVQGDRILVTGIQSTLGTGQNPPTTRFTVGRVLPDGNLDATFGDGGLATVSFDAAAFAIPSDVGVEPDGTIVAIGSAQADGSTPSRFVAARLAADGRQVLNRIDGSATGNVLAVQPDGRIVVAGVTASQAGYAYVVTRLNPDLSLDPTFGVGGRVSTPVNFGPVVTGGLADLTLQADGCIVVVAPPSGFGAVRYDADGRLDPTFGTGGIVGTPAVLERPIGASPSVAISPNGTIVVGSSFTLVRYLGSSVVETTDVEGFFVRAGRGRRFVHPVARFTTSDPGVTGGAFRVSIDWGDRSRPSVGRLVPSGPGTFLVVGAHRYNRNGLYRTTILVEDASGSVAQGGGFVSVGRDRDHLRNARILHGGRVPGGPRLLYGLRGGVGA